MNSVRFDVAVSNLTQTDIAITQIRVDIQEPIPSTRDDQKWQVISQEIQVPPGVTVPRTITMPGLDDTWGDYASALLHNPRVLTLAPGDYDATVLVDRRRLGETQYAVHVPRRA